MNPDLESLPADGLADHFLTYGLRERRKYSDSKYEHVHVERIACADRDFVLYGWSEHESGDLGVLLVKEEGGKVEWEFIDAAGLWHWRDDVAKHLNLPPRTERHGVVMAGRATRFDPAGAQIYVYAHNRFIDYSGVFEPRQSARELYLECFRLLQSQQTHKELVFLLSRYPGFLAQITLAHEQIMAEVPVAAVFESANEKAAYSICAVVLGNPQMLKAWLMALPDHHDLSKCEVNILCNGSDGYDNVVRAARWFAEGLGGFIRVFYSPHNLGFNIAVNHLVRLSTTEHVMVTNIDVKYRRFDYDKLVTLCQGDKWICAARQFNGMGALQHLSLGITVKQEIVHGEAFSAVESKLIGRNTFPADKTGIDQEVQYFGAACFFASRKLLHTLGPFSPRFLYAYHEDSDLALRARALGAKLVVTPALDLVHYESSGSTVDLPKSFFIAANSVLLLKSMQQLPEADPGEERARTKSPLAADRKESVPETSKASHFRESLRA
ncbi:glycosyltransferase family 2 protein [Caenimonas aquaedulcis]|uniref:Glycosyltransferase family 2 protein n=1 Tax=Caenimonas aquaedulcis TaxID=2793270 RepID=A0A931MGM8_9BURK|nr:glycosyltransferase family 2 protein [Caenimonas aquaedulcis]MBG9388187.1 glycosyltransferase family 2 protein [Caenimonas aquaedulcis]